MLIRKGKKPSEIGQSPGSCCCSYLFQHSAITPQHIPWHVAASCGQHLWLSTWELSLVCMHRVAQRSFNACKKSPQSKTDGNLRIITLSSSPLELIDNSEAYFTLCALKGLNLFRVITWTSFFTGFLHFPISHPQSLTGADWDHLPNTPLEFKTLSLGLLLGKLKLRPFIKLESKIQVGLQWELQWKHTYFHTWKVIECILLKQQQKSLWLRSEA